MTENFIDTYTGRQFFPQRETNEFAIEDIGHALSLMCRYTGHVNSFFSVAEHCVLMADYANETGFCDPYEALMHDAGEAYLSDIARPIKVLLPDYLELEKKIDSQLRTQFYLPVNLSKEVKQLDFMMLKVERTHLMNKTGNRWDCDDVELLEIYPKCWEPREAEQRFLEAYKRYGPKYGNSVVL